MNCGGDLCPYCWYELDKFLMEWYEDFIDRGEHGEADEYLRCPNCKRKIFVEAYLPEVQFIVSEVA